MSEGDTTQEEGAPATNPGPGLRSHLAFALAALAVALVHLALMWHYIPPELVLSEDPIARGDLSVHLAQAKRVFEGMVEAGETWAYDVSLLAGFPTGTIFDADNKAWALWTYVGVRKLGWSLGAAWNSFLVLAHLLVPVVVFAAARLLRFTRWPALVAAAGASAFWFFDSFVHWCWWIGMVEYDFAGYLFLLPLGLFYRFVEERRVWQAVASGLSLGLCLLVHPYTFFMLAPPMIFLWLRDARELEGKHHAMVVGVALFAIAVNLWWLRVAFDFWHYILDSAYYGQAGLDFLVADFFGTLLDPETSGFISVRTGFRLLFVAAAGVQLWRWRKQEDRRFGLFAVALGSYALLSYCGSYLSLTAQIQPYRFVVSLGFLAAMPAAELAVRGFESLRAGEWSGREKVLAGVLAVPALQHLGADVVYFMPELQPRLETLSNGETPGITGTGFAFHATLRYGEAVQDRLVCDWIDAHDDGQGRVLVENAPLGDELAWRTDAQVLGGFTVRNLQHSYSNFYRRYPDGVLEDQAALADYFETYAVRYVVVTRPDAYLGEPNPMLELVANFGWHRIFRVKEGAVAVNLVAEGGGRVEARTNHLKVRGSDPEADVVLRFHWLESLVCEPECSIEREPIDEVDVVGFIRVPAPHPADFEISNSYEMP